jgi:hypothetical protein
LRQGFSEQLVQRPRLHVREDPFFLNMIEILSEEVHNPVSHDPKLCRIHE